MRIGEEHRFVKLQDFEKSQTFGADFLDISRARVRPELTVSSESNTVTGAGMINVQTD
jgi:hypothetical protein